MVAVEEMSITVTRGMGGVLKRHEIVVIRDLGDMS